MPTPDTIPALQVAADPDFHKRLRLLLLDVALDVLSENASTPNHDERCRYAVSVFRNQHDAAQRAAYVVVASRIEAVAGVTDHLQFTDTAVRTALTSVFNSLAGVYEPETAG